MTQGLILAFIGLVGLWLIGRICVFFADRMDSVTLPPDIYPITASMLRLILLAVASGVMILAIPGALFAAGLGHSAFFGDYASPTEQKYANNAIRRMAARVYASCLGLVDEQSVNMSNFVCLPSVDSHPAGVTPRAGVGDAGR